MDPRVLLSAWSELAAVARVEGTRADGLLSPRVEGARHRLGTGVGDLTLPYAIGADLKRAFRDALTELVLLYVSRNRAVFGDAVHDALLLSDDVITAPLQPRAFTPPSGLRNPVMRAAMTAAPRLLAGLDSGVLTTWWGEQGRGRGLLRVWAELLGQAIDEAATTDFEEDTPLVFTWVVPDLFAEALVAARHPAVPQPAQREIGAALLLALHLSQQVVHAQVLAARPARTDAARHLATRWTAAATPRLAFRPATALLSHCRFTPSAPREHPIELGEVLEALGHGGADAAVSLVEERLHGDRRLRPEAIRTHGRASLRERLLGVLATGLPEGSELWSRLWEWVRSERALVTELSDKKLRKQLSTELDRAAAGTRPDLARRLGELSGVVKRWNPDRPVGGLAVPEREALRTVAVDLIADLLDRAVEAATPKALGVLQPRTGGETDRGLREEHEAGRLYLFEVGSTAILRQRVAASTVGHLFTDLKDFTRRTAHLKEEVMAEFLRTEFYAPILALAREHHHGLVQLSDRGGIHLNNLVGDAVTFSGDIVALMQLARAVRRHLRAYSTALRARLAEVPGAEAWVAELVAGTYVAYGAAPSVIQLDDPVWGNLRVAVAEKINESARGCARTGSVIASVLAMLQYQRRIGGRPELVLPFRVYISNALGLQLAPPQELALRRALAEGRADRALEIYTIAAERNVESLSSGGPSAARTRLEAGGLLYNAGEAVSGEALRAYGEAMRSAGPLKAAGIRSADLEDSLHERYAFLTPGLRLAGLLDAHDRPTELFRYAGSVTFKGLESGGATEVWEVLDPDNPATRMLQDSRTVVTSLREGRTLDDDG